MFGLKIRKWVVFVFIILCFSPQKAFAAWIWTPESKGWVNPRNTPKDTPQEHLDYILKIYAKKNYKRTMKECRKLVKYYPRSKEAAEAQYYIGLCYQAQSKFTAAFKAYQIVIDKYPFSERAAEIVERQYNIGISLLDNRENQGKILHTIVGGDYDVIEIFKAVIKNAPYGEYAAPSQYKIAAYLKEKKMYPEAREEFEKTVNEYPNTEWAKAARYQIALADARRSSDSQHDQKVTQEAVKGFKDFIREYPDAELSNKAKDEIQQLRNKEAENKFLVASFYAKQQKYQAAKIYYSMIIDDYQDTLWAAKALEKLRELNQNKDL